MRTLKIILIIICTLIAALVSFEMIRTMTNPLTKSEENISERILKEIPLGTQMDEVIRYLENKTEWEIESISYEYGFLHQRKVPNERIGVKSIRVFMGEYSAFNKLYFWTYVTAFFGFNKESELIDIWVWKTTDTF